MYAIACVTRPDPKNDTNVVQLWSTAYSFLRIRHLLIIIRGIWAREKGVPTTSFPIYIQKIFILITTYNVRIYLSIVFEIQLSIIKFAICFELYKHFYVAYKV